MRQDGIRMGEDRERAAMAQRGADMCFALRLDHLHPDRAIKAEAITRDAVALVTALEGQRYSRFVLQTLCRPDTERPERGRIEVHLVAFVRGAEDPVGLGCRDVVEELRDDLVNLLGAPPLRWSFSTVADGEELAASSTPSTPWG